MKHNISSSLKTTLFTALPFLTLSLFAVSCSNDESAVIPEKTTEGKAISFTAVAPEITDYTTRIGLDETNLPSSDIAPEPLIWLDGDKLAFNFVKYGEPNGQVIEYTATNIGNGGFSCDFRTDQEMNLENGLYQVYVVGPSVATTFQGGVVSGTAIDLRGQSQPGVTANYRNLTDYFYYSAYTILEIRDNKVVYGSTALTFSGLTSMLRYQITNTLPNEVGVKKIKISHFGTSDSQFYTQGSFDPSSGSSIVPTSLPVSALSLATDRSLPQSSVFNAYMTMIPTSGFTGGLNQLSATIYFYIGGDLKKRVWDWPATSVSNNGTFPADSRFMFNLTLRPGEYVSADPSELLDEEEGPITPPVIPAESVTITSNSTSNEIAVDETLELSATINPAGATGTIVWSSSDESVATIDQSGVVTGLSIGTTSISATVLGSTPVIKDEFILTVAVAIGAGTDIIDDKEYITYTYNDGNNDVTWMVQPLRDSSQEIIYAQAPINCPSPYKWPTNSDLQRLYSQLLIEPSLPELFLDYAFNVNGIVGDIASRPNEMYIIGDYNFYYNPGWSKGYMIPCVFIRVYNGSIDYSKTDTWVQRDGVNRWYPARCVKIH